jgi:hypothetical protein
VQDWAQNHVHTLEIPDTNFFYVAAAPPAREAQT